MNGLLDFVRPKISFTGAVVAVFGFLLFNSFGAQVLLVFLSAFFATAFAYSYNAITDTKEDSMNRGVSKYAASHYGPILSLSFAVVGGAIASFLGLQPMLFYLLVVGVSFAYSFFRVKWIFPWKSVYVGFGYCTIFLFGASLGPITLEVLLYYLLISMTIFAMGTIADMRDCHGDKKVGIPTLPAVLGKEKVGGVVYLSLAIPFAVISMMGLYKMYALLPFALCAGLLLYADAHPQLAHNYMRVGVLLMPVLLMLTYFGE